MLLCFVVFGAFVYVCLCLLFVWCCSWIVLGLYVGVCCCLCLFMGCLFYFVLFVLFAVGCVVWLLALLGC